MVKTIKDDQPRTYFDCDKCPAFCCSIYERVTVTKRDINKLAKHFGITPEEAMRRHTKLNGEERVLRRKPDELLGEACKFLDRKTRGCGIYHARPAVCREYPNRPRCVYYDVLQFERKQQGDENVLPLFKIVFREAGEESSETAAPVKKPERVWQWTPE